VPERSWFETVDWSPLHHGGSHDTSVKPDRTDFKLVSNFTTLNADADRQLPGERERLDASVSLLYGLSRCPRYDGATLLIANI